MRTDFIYPGSRDWTHRCCQCGQHFAAGLAIDYWEYCLRCGQRTEHAIHVQALEKQRNDRWQAARQAAMHARWED